MVTDDCRLPFCVETTAPGRGAISVVEVVGRAGWPCVKKLIPARNFRRCPRIALVDLVGPDGPIDQAIIARVPAREALTGHDTIEINTHGGPACVGRLVDALRRLGVPVRSRRQLVRLALRSGRLDLTQVEALELLHEATTFRAASFLMRQFDGELSAAVHRILDRLELACRSARRAGGRVASRKCATVLRNISRLLSTADLALALAEPGRCVIAGAPNVGKSSLFNALLGMPRAIVHPDVGTTRDHVKEITSHHGIPFMLVDTAGLSSPDVDATETGAAGDEIRKAAECCSLGQIRKARVLLVVIDAPTFAARHATPADLASLVPRLKRTPSVTVVNKTDLLTNEQRAAIARSDNPETIPPHMLVSALTGEGLEELKEAVIGLIVPASTRGHDSGAGVFTSRQRRALLRLQETVRDAATSAGLRVKDTRNALRRAIDVAQSLVSHST